MMIVMKVSSAKLIIDQLHKFESVILVMISQWSIFHIAIDIGRCHVRMMASSYKHFYLEMLVLVDKINKVIILK